jgi:Guanine nucleotide exchange factor synembryn
MISLLQDLASALDASATYSDGDVILVDALSVWNDQVNDILTQPPLSQQAHIDQTQQTFAAIASNSNSNNNNNISNTHSSDDHVNNIASLLLTVSEKLQAKLHGHLPDASNMQNSPCASPTPSANNGNDAATPVQTILRTCGLWVRWYLQIARSTQHYSPTWEDSLAPFQSPEMMRVYMHLIEKFALVCTEIARCASQLLFYTTYSITSHPHSSHYDREMQLYQFLTDDLDLFTRLLHILITVPTVSLALSLVRNLHHALASFPKATLIVKDTNVDAPTASTDTPPAFFLSESSLSDNIASKITYHTVLVSMAQWVVKSVHRSHVIIDTSASRSAEPLHLHEELLTEIARCMYALQYGALLRETIDPENQSLSALVKDIYQQGSIQEDSIGSCTDNGIETESKDSDRKDNHKHAKLSRECQLAFLPVLMDADASYAPQVVDCALQWLLLLEDQVTLVLDTRQITDGAAAVLAPLLVVIYKFCAHSPFQQHILQGVFPPSAEVQYLTSVAAQQQSQQVSNQRGQLPKNMSPLDAPRGTLRWKLIQLLTWPQGHVKRFAGELLWVLCNQDPQEFVYRVGLGNGLPLLASKNIVQMPSSLT